MTIIARITVSMISRCFSAERHCGGVFDAFTLACITIKAIDRLVTRNNLHVTENGNNGNFTYINTERAVAYATTEHAITLPDEVQREFEWQKVRKSTPE